MTAIIYLFKRTIINSIKELRKKPLKLIAYLAFLGFMIFAAFTGLKMEGDFTEGRIELFNAIFLFLTLFFLFLAVRNGTEKGNTLFRMADVNLLFPAPIKPQQILIYGFVKQLATSLTLVLILMVQIPNIHLHFPVKGYGGLLIIGNVVLLNILVGILSIFIYALGSLREGNTGLIKTILYGLVAVLGIGALAFLAKSQNIMEGMLDYLNSPVFNYIPVISWILYIFQSAIFGFDIMTLGSLGLLILFSGLLIFLVYRMDLDYYEDALDSTLVKERTMAKAKEGQTAYNPRMKVRKTRSKIQSSGAKAILSKQILIANKTGFAFIDFSTLIIVAISLVFSLFSGADNMIFLLYMLTYMNLIFSLGGSWVMELKNHYIFLIPAPARLKIFYATIMDVFKSFIGGLLAFTLAAFLLKEDIIQVPILALSYTSFTSLFLYSELFIRRLLGGRVNPTVTVFFKLILNILLIIPGIALSFFLSYSLDNFIIYGEFLVIILYNVLVSSLFIFLSKGIFEKVEME